MMKLKSCPQLLQVDMRNSNLVVGESYTRSRLSPCIKEKCAAFDWERGHFYCRKYGTRLDYCEEEKEGQA